MSGADIAWHAFNGLCLIVWIVNIVRWVRSGFRVPRIIRLCVLASLIVGVVALVTLAFLAWLNWKMGVSCILFPPLVVFLFWFIPLLASVEEDLQ